VLYLFYGCFTLVGFFIWMRVQKKNSLTIETAFPDPTVSR
jgi:nicotinamide mononucleotide transporter